MNELSTQSDFYPPDVKELGLGMCCVLEQEGGCLTLQRVADVLGDFLQIPESILAISHPHPNWDTTKWGYHLAWVCTDLRKHGFMVRIYQALWDEVALLAKTPDAGDELKDALRYVTQTGTAHGIDAMLKLVAL